MVESIRPTRGPGVEASVRSLRRKAHELKRAVQAATLPKSVRRHALVGPPRLWEMKRTFQISFLQQVAGLEPHHRVLDVGCGTLRGGVPLIRYLDEGQYVGIDVRAEAIAAACEELRDHGLSDKNAVLCYAGSLEKLEVLPRFDYVWAFSVFMHLDDANLHTLLTFARRALGQEGAFYANANVGHDDTDRAWQGFPIVWRSWEELVDAAERAAFTVEDLGDLASFGHKTGTGQDAQRMLLFRPTAAA